MARFPKSEAEVATLAQAMVGGLTASVAIYPTPPVSYEDLNIIRTAYNTARNAAIAAQAAAEQATTDKDAALVTLIDAMKSDLRYAENTVDDDDEKLKLIGWGGRKPRTPLTAPGQTRLLEARIQGEGDLTLAWRAPVDGGKPSAYRVMRRQRPEGPWSDVGTAVVTEIELADQPRGVEFEYRIIAINKAGAGEPSNTVVVVL